MTDTLQVEAEVATNVNEVGPVKPTPLDGYFDELKAKGAEIISESENHRVFLYNGILILEVKTLPDDNIIERMSEVSLLASSLIQKEVIKDKMVRYIFIYRKKPSPSFGLKAIKEAKYPAGASYLITASAFFAHESELPVYKWTHVLMEKLINFSTKKLNIENTITKFFTIDQLTEGKVIEWINKQPQEA